MPQWWLIKAKLQQEVLRCSRYIHHTSRDRRKKRQMRSGGGTTMGARPRRHQLLAPITANARTHPTITAKQNQARFNICIPLHTLISPF
ncbi:unnamed protein product [Toxocara canis]|uniref:Secreted protein n=1 Tax=Toxocara canis TaxID=6265 RepID=A0A183VCE3_TOXCA|nr:unnamed protein product [Toxocara canis]